MNYVKSCLIITMLLGVQIGYSQCNGSNWEEYYPEMEGCDLEGVDLSGANLIDANLERADLYDSKFIQAFLIRANLAWTYIHQVDLVGANLSCANFSGAYFYLTNLTNTIWDEYGITDENDDEYDDTFYDAGYVDGAESGDLTLDGANDVLDVVTLVNNILNS